MNINNGELWGIHQACDLTRYVQGDGGSVPQALGYRGARAPSDGYTVTSQGVAIVSFAGPAMRNPGPVARWYGFTSYRDTAAAITQAAADREVKSIVLVIDSPGGAVDGVTELADAVRAARESKTVVAQVDGLACSCGYWIASQASQIVASRSLDTIGNIGVYMVLVDYTEWNKDKGLRVEIIDTGDKKTIGHSDRAISDSDIQFVQSHVDVAFGEFRRYVMEGRGMDAAQFKALADGRFVYASKSIELGLIDDIQPLESTIADLSGRRSRSANRSAQANAIKTAQAMQDRTPSC